MISLQWQDGVLSFWTRRPTRSRSTGSPAPPWRRPPKPSPPAPFWRRRSLRWLGSTATVWPPWPTRNSSRPPSFRRNWTRPRPCSWPAAPAPELAAALDFMEHPPEAYTKNVDQLTTLLATAVTYDRQQVIADRNICRNGTDLMGEGTRLLLRTDRGAFHSASPLRGPGHRPPGLEAGCAGAGHPLRGPPLPGRRHAAGPGAVQGKRPLHPHPRPRRRHLPGPAKGPIWCWPTEFWLRKRGI